MNSSLDLSAWHPTPPPIPIHTAAEMAKLVKKGSPYDSIHSFAYHSISLVYCASLHREPQMKAIGYGVRKKLLWHQEALE